MLLPPGANSIPRAELLPGVGSATGSRVPTPGFFASLRAIGFVDFHRRIVPFSLCAYLVNSANCNLSVRCMAPGNEGRAPRLPLGGSCQPNRLTEGESLGILDAAPNEALVVDQRSLLQSASRPAPSQREPLACTTRFGFPFIQPTIC